MEGKRNLINGNLTKANFSDKYKCDSILGKYQYGRSNSVVLNKAIEEYDKMSEEEQDKNIVEKFSYIKRVVPCSDEDLIKSIKDESLQLSQYEYLKDTPRYSDMTIELLARYDVVKMTKKSNWTMEDITKIFNERKNDILKRLYLYTGETETKSNKQEETRAEKIYNRLCDNNTKKVIEKTPLVNFINDFFASEKQDYDCRVFFNDKSIYIYQSELEEIKKINRKYRTNEKDGRRIVRMVCLLLAWQKAFQNQYYNHRLNGYARLRLDNLMAYNPIVESENGRVDSVAMIADRKKLVEDGYIELLLPEVAAPREIAPDLYYKLSFCVDKNNTDNEEVALTITDFENIWEQIFVAAFKEFDVLEEPKEKDIKQGEIKEYDKKQKRGKVYIAEKDKTYSFSGTGKYKIGDTVNVYIQDSKKGKIKILKKPNERVYVTYKAVKRCSTCGKMFYAKQMGDGTGNCDVCNRR